MITVQEIGATPIDLNPPNTTSHTQCGDTCIADSEWYIRLVTDSGRITCRIVLMHNKYTRLHLIGETFLCNCLLQA